MALAANGPVAMPFVVVVVVVVGGGAGARLKLWNFAEHLAQAMQLP